IVVELTPGRQVRIPSVGPGARIVHARLGIGAEDLPFRVVRDGAENWFLDALGTAGTRRARLVMELAIPRRAFGGDFADPTWADLPLVPPLPDAVAREAAIVRGVIGVSRLQRPRDAVSRLVQYFRSFAESDEPPKGWGSVYLDLAMSKKGVCRHRAFAFLVTAQSLGIPTRLVMNEAHAWVEVHDGTSYRRIDLGGAGRMESGPQSDRVAYEPPPDAFRWPPGAKRGSDMVADARASGRAGAPASPAPAASPFAAPGRSTGPAAPAASVASPAPHGASPSPNPMTSRLPPHAAHVALDVVDLSPHRREPMRVRGLVTAGGQACDHVTVDLWLTSASPLAPGPAADRGPNASIHIGSLATDDRGAFDGTVILPAGAPLGDYDVVATAEGSRCGDGDAR
ncbi:MAG: transglutaminase domain-containing protein, partial [Polyangiaceae bacterium]|nr:transglutaminase domain-containing protein [Polyangiaceae bacterium]